MDMKKEIEKAQTKLGIEQLKRYQVNPIISILDQGDTFVVVPPSEGKSAIYQVPALIFPGVTLVIEPTLLLIYDQVSNLQLHGISTAYIDYSMTFHETLSVLKKAQNEKIKFLFVTPERLQNQMFRKEISSVPVSLVVVDEAHCVTTWGNGFRPAYLRIGEFIDMLPDSPITVALTSLATPQMCDEICERLSMKQPDIFINSRYRPNLYFTKRTFGSDEDKLRRLKRMLRRRKYQYCVIYCNTVKMADDVYEKVNEWFPGKATKCHSNLDDQERKENALLFFNGEKRIMVATSAFQVAVDHLDINLVIHYNLPLSLIEYYQQVGRAGRTGFNAKCVLLHSKADYNVNLGIINSTNNEMEKERMLAELEQMKEYANGSGCLHQQILFALGEVRDKPCGQCTNCQKKKKRCGER